jgi:hypothetical protein
MIKYKYYFIYPEKRFKILIKGNNKKELFKNLNNKLNKKNIKENTVFILLLIQNNSKTVISTTGPIKVTIIFYKITKRGALKVNKSDNRTNIIFYTQEYLNKNKIRSKDLKKISKGAYNNKLEKRLFAPKLINQISNIKL